MRTTHEVMEAARMGEPCTEEELRMCIVSMRSVIIFAHMDHAHWAVDKGVPGQIQMKAQLHWDNVSKGFDVPLDVRVNEENRPGHPSLAKRKKIAEAVFRKMGEAKRE